MASHRDALELLLLSIRNFNGTDCFAVLLTISSVTLCPGLAPLPIRQPAAACDGRRAVELFMLLTVYSSLGPADRCASLNRLEVVLLEVVGDLVAEHRTLHIGGAEVDTSPHSRIDNFFQNIRETVEASRGAGFVTEDGDSDLVCAEEVLERVHERTGVRGVTRWVVGKGRREERRWMAHWCRWVEQRQPCGVGLSVRVAVGVGLADRGDCSPELPVILVVPTANGRISSGQVLHRKQARAVNDVQLLADGQRAKDAVKHGVSVILPKDRSIRLIRRSGYAR